LDGVASYNSGLSAARFFFRLVLKILGSKKKGTVSTVFTLKTSDAPDLE